MTPQIMMLDRLRELCQKDSTLTAATLYGSFTVGEGDAYSDIECVLFFDAAFLPSINKQAWVSQIAPTLVFFADDFGHYTAIFDNLVRGEFHFDSIDSVHKVTSWKGNAWFPSAESCILVDRTGELQRALQPLLGTPPERDTLQIAEHLIHSFVNLMIFGMNTLARGEFARSHELLQAIDRILLWMARLSERTTSHWPTPSKRLEKDLSALSYARFKTCTSALEPMDLRQAYHTSWQWGQELSVQLTSRHNIHLHAALFPAITSRYFND